MLERSVSLGGTEAAETPPRSMEATQVLKKTSTAVKKAKVEKVGDPIPLTPSQNEKVKKLIICMTSSVAKIDELARDMTAAKYVPYLAPMQKTNVAMCAADLRAQHAILEIMSENGTCTGSFASMGIAANAVKRTSDQLHKSISQAMTEADAAMKK